VYVYWDVNIGEQKMFIGNLILTVLMAIQPSQETADIRVRISVFEVPFMIVSYTVAGVSKDGGVVGTMVGGSTTRSFPRDAVTLQNRLAAGSHSVEIKTAIREFMAYSCIRAQDITVHELAEHELVFDHQGEAGHEVYQELDQGRPSPFSYRLDIEPAWESDEEAGLALQVWFRWQNPYGLQDISGEVPERLAFDQTVAVKFGQTSLVGLPSSTSGRRFIYWLAVTVEKSCR
jgi:hypothetical protein